MVEALRNGLHRERDRRADQRRTGLAGKGRRLGPGVRRAGFQRLAGGLGPGGRSAAGGEGQGDKDEGGGTHGVVSSGITGQSEGDCDRFRS